MSAPGVAESMSRRRKEPHLFLRSKRRDSQGRITHRASWIIKDGDNKLSTGCGKDEHDAAQLKLHEYNVERYRQKALNVYAEDDDPAVPAKDYPIATALMLYQHHKVAKMNARLSTKGKQPAEGVAHKQVGDLTRRLAQLLDYWGDKTVGQINRDRCRKFDTVQTKDGPHFIHVQGRFGGLYFCRHEAPSRNGWFPRRSIAALQSLK
jgi:hypothetical protein